MYLKKSLMILAVMLGILILSSCGRWLVGPEGNQKDINEGRANKSDAKNITMFSILGNIGTIEEAALPNPTIDITVPFGTVVTGLVATFTTTGSSVAIGVTPQVRGVTFNNFINPVTYTVTAANDTTKDYFVTINVRPIPGIEWQNTVGGNAIDAATSIQQTRDGGYIFAGYTTSTNGDISGYHTGVNSWDFDFLVVKLDAFGNIQWQKCLGGVSEDEAYSIQQTSDDGYIIVGMVRSNNGDVSGNHGSYDMWAVKLAPDTGTSTPPEIEWQKCLGGTMGDYGFSVRQTVDGGYVIAGLTWSNDGDVSGNHGGTDAWIIKLDPSGNIQWKKCFGGTNYDDASSIIQTSDGGFIFTGMTRSNNGDLTGLGYHGGFDIWVVKLAPDTGTNTPPIIEWKKCFGGTGDDGLGSIQQTSDGGYIMIGFTTSNDGDVSGNHGSDDIWVIKLNSVGSIQWQKCLGGSGIDDGGSIQQTFDGGYILTGDTYSNNGDVSGNHGEADVWVVKLDATGNIVWQKCLGGTGTEYPQSIQETSDYGFIIAGFTSSNNNDVSGYHGGSDDTWIVKLTP